MARPRSDIDTRILHAARVRFLREGVDGASLRAIADDAGTSVGMVYYYFPTKDQLFLAVVEEIYERVLADFSRALAADVPVPARLARLYQRIGQLSDDELTVIRLVIREALVSSSRLDSIIARFQRGHIPLVLATVAAGRAAGDFNADQHPLLQIAAIVGVGIVPQIVARVVGARLPALTPARAAPAGVELANLGPSLVDVLLNGIGGARRTGGPPGRTAPASSPAPSGPERKTRARPIRRSASTRPSR